MDNIFSIKPQNWQFIYRGLWDAVDFIYPPYCAACGKPGFVFCSDCIDNVSLIGQSICQICGYPLPEPGICENCLAQKPPYKMMRSWAEYSGPLRDALISLKYHSNLEMGYLLSLPLTAFVKQLGWQFDLIVPIPLSQSHQRIRGYNQSFMIARPLSRFLQIDFSSNSVTRVKETQSQVDLSREERFKNLFGAFQGNSAKLLNKRVLLVDDISTTGATMNSCSTAILNAGGKEVYCLTVARTRKNCQ